MDDRKIEKGMSTTEREKDENMVRARERERDISAIVPSESPLIQHCHGDWFLWLFQHGIQLVSQVIEHAADVIEDANCGLLLSHRAKHTHRIITLQWYSICAGRKTGCEMCKSSSIDTLFIYRCCAFRNVCF